MIELGWLTPSLSAEIKERKTIYNQILSRFIGRRMIKFYLFPLDCDINSLAHGKIFFYLLLLSEYFASCTILFMFTNCKGHLLFRK